MCTILDCDKEISLLCSGFNASYCTDPLIHSFCPSLCGYDVDLSMIKSNCSNKTTDVMHTTITPNTCEKVLNCTNEGTFNPNDCTCKCLPAWSGSCKDFDRN